MSLLASDYRPPILFRNGHLSTIYSALLRRVPAPEPERERLELPDGDFLDLDWTKSAEPTRDAIVLLHGLEGNASRPYMAGSALLFSQRGYDVCGVNLRGCSGEPNRLFRSYHSGATEDLAAVVAHLERLGRYDRIYLKGFSLGGNLILKYLGELGGEARITAAVAISVPCDLHDSLLQLNMPKNLLYARRFLRNLKDKLRLKRERFPEQLPPATIRKIRTLKDFDDLYTSRAHGFKDALDYYARCSSKPLLPRITVPTLLLNAQNDSFLGEKCYPVAECSNHPWLHLERPAAGGHVGFYLPGKHYYNEVRALQFLGEYR